MVPHSMASKNVTTQNVNLGLNSQRFTFLEQFFVLPKYHQRKTMVFIFLSEQEIDKSR